MKPSAVRSANVPTECPSEKAAIAFLTSLRILFKC